MSINKHAEESLKKLEVAKTTFRYPKRTAENLTDESALLELFKTYKCNSEIEYVLIKVAALNELYSAGVPNMALNTMANRIAALANEFNLNLLINNGDIKAVCLIGNCKNTCPSGLCASNISGNDYIDEEFNQYISFASKFCSFQERANRKDRDSFPMYDTLSRETLKVITKEHRERNKEANQKLKYKFTDFDSKYCCFKCVIDTLFNPPHYLGKPLTYREIDDFLW